VRIYSRLFIYCLLLLPLLLYPKSIKIASYNVENLFDMRSSGLEYRDYIPNRHNWTESMLNTKLYNLAKVICDIDADVIGLQEIENEHALKSLQRVLGRVGCSYSYHAITDTKKTTVHNALLSRIPIKKRKDIVIYRNSRHRSILEVDIKADPPMRVFVNHWKSKQGPESKRIPYAKALAKRLNSLPKGLEYILLGDFNSNYDEFQTISKKHNDTNGVVGINHILNSVYNSKLVRLHNLSSTEGLHCNLWLELSHAQRWSHNFFGQKESIDSILIPASMRDMRGWEYVDDSFGVFKPSYLFGKRGEIRRWGYKSGKHTGKGYSDHLPIYATFNLGKVSKSNVGIWDKLTSLLGSHREMKIVPKIVAKINNTDRLSTIEDIISIDRVEQPIQLSDAKVIFKRYKSAIIKQTHSGRAMLLYGCAEQLSEGVSYDIVVHKKKRYNGLDEITDIEVSAILEAEQIASYIRQFSISMMSDTRYINEIVGDIETIYHKNSIEVSGQNIPIYFKKIANRPQIGSKIRIKRAQIGYYKNHIQLVVWDRNDYEIVK